MSREDDGGGGRRAMVFVAILATYGVALAVPALVDSSRDQSLTGLEALRNGYFVPVPWSANAFLLFGMLTYLGRRSTPALICAGLALGLGSTTIPFCESKLSDLKVGFYLWMLCFVLLGVGAGLEMLLSKSDAAAD